MNNTSSESPSVEPTPPKFAGPILAREVRAIGLLAETVLRHRRAVARVAIVVGFVIGLIGLLFPREWTSETLFTPQLKRGVASISGLAAQLGLSQVTEGSTQNAAFYVQLITSDELLGRLAESPITDTTDGAPRTRTVAQMLRLRGTGATIRADAIRQLRDAVVVTSNPRTSVITLAVTSTNPEWSRQMAQRLLGLVDEFNQVTRTSQARQERAFTEKRSWEAKRELTVAEENLRSFLERNRQVATSPILLLERARLEREISRREAIYSMLASAFEQARIEEVRDTPVLVILQAPRSPARPNKRGLLLKTVASIIGAAILTMLWLVVIEQLRLVEATERDLWIRLHGVLGDTMHDLRNPWLIIRRSR